MVYNKLIMPKGRDNRKKNQGVADLHKKEIMSECRNTEDIEVILNYTHHEDNDIRLEAVKQLCPCKVLKDIDVFWERVLELVNDEDVRIRSRILHIICDGSPERLEDRIYEALKEFNRDKDSDIRRTAHKVIATYEHTGKWNIL
jgi:hypothetical protein